MHLYKKLLSKRIKVIKSLSTAELHIIEHQHIKIYLIFIMLHDYCRLL